MAPSRIVPRSEIRAFTSSSTRKSALCGLAVAVSGSTSVLIILLDIPEDRGGRLTHPAAPDRPAMARGASGRGEARGRGRGRGGGRQTRKRAASSGA